LASRLPAGFRRVSEDGFEPPHPAGARQTRFAGFGYAGDVSRHIEIYIGVLLMLTIFKELKSLLIAKPYQMKIITYYSIINFILSLIANLILLILFFIFIFNENDLKFIYSFIPLLLIAITVINYLILFINKYFLKGSIKAYWLLLIVYILECISFKLGVYKFSFNLTGFPIGFTIDLQNNNEISFNIIPLFIIIYLIIIKSQYHKIISDSNYLKNLYEEKRKVLLKSIE
jgi:hypothetical protein